MVRSEDLKAFLRSRWWHKVLSSIKGAYIVGGSLRDLLLGKEVRDIDIVFKPSYDMLIPQKFASDIFGKLIILGKKDQTYRVTKPPFIFDFTPLKEAEIFEDLVQRDFTINSLAWDIEEEKLIDPLGGLDDLLGRKIRANSNESLLKDRIRILRAFRFRSTLGFDIEEKTKLLIEGLSSDSPWKFIAKERMAEEWKKLIKSTYFSLSMKDMSGTGFLESLFPIFRKMRSLPQNAFHHLDVLNHTLKAIEALEDILTAPPHWADKGYIKGKEHLLRMATLFHDVGKVYCFKRFDGEINFKGHQFVGAKIVRSVSKALLFNDKERKTLVKLVFNHMMPILFVKRQREGRPYERSLLSWLDKVMDDACGIFLISLADLEATRGEKTSDEDRNTLSEIAKRAMLHLKDMKVKPILNGREIMKITGISPGPLVGNLKERLLHLQKMGKLKTKSEAIRALLGII